MLKPKTRLGPYEVVSLLGRGGMGEVYRATDTRLGRDVALKVLSRELSSDSKLVHRFEQEARAASALNHPNITTIHDIGEADSIFYIAMELVEGKTLREILASGPLPTRRLLQIATQIAEGLAKAHAAGFVHRDLKPENIMVTADGLAKILDFGLAKLAQPWALGADGGEETTIGRATEPGIILGTVGYMSPEQASGHAVGVESDQFSLGAILYEMATGRRAFERGTTIETLNALIREEPARIETLNPNVPAPLRWVLERCLTKNAEHRYASTRDLARDLQNLQERQVEVEGLSSATLPVRRAIRTSPLRLLALVGVVIALMACLVGAFLLGRGRGGPLPAFRQLTFRHGNIRGARLAPDGRTVIYGATWIGAPPDVYVIRPESPQSGSLSLGNAGVFSVSAGGEMAVALGCRLNWGECIGTLAQVPLAGGAPREILKDVHGADWGPDGRTLAAVVSTEGAYRLHYPIGTVLYEAPGWITYARVSPKGDGVAFLDHPTLGDISGSVCIVDVNGNKTTLSTGWKALQGLAWSGTGDEIWFTGSRVSKGGSLALHAVTRSGREREIFSSAGTLKLYDISRDGQRVLLMRGTPRASIVSLGPDAAQERELSWFDYSTVADLSADGKTLLFYEWGQGVEGTLMVFLRKTDGSDAIRLGEGRPLALSPDGRWAVVVQQTTPPQLLLLPTGPGEVRRLPRGAVTEYLDWAAWSPDGRRVFFAGQESAGNRRTYVQDIGGGDPRPVTPDGLVGTLLSPDGKLIVAFDRYGEYYLCPVGAAGEPRPLDGYVDGDVLIQWSADGRFLFVREAGNLALRIHTLDLSTGRRELWKTLTPADAAALIDIGSDPGQIRLTPDGKSYAYTYRTFAGELYLVQGLR
jgi:Tol biopolymer transport system component